METQTAFANTKESSSLKWFFEQEKLALERENPDVMTRIYRARGICDFKVPPDWYRRECEAQFRKGYRDGYLAAVEHVQELHRKGFGRPAEIVNILGEFCEILRRWARSAWRDDVKEARFSHGVPRFSHDSWWELRTRVLNRDKRACVRCGSTVRLEVHHATAVCEGGLPTLENLTTLCFQCHRGTNCRDDDEPMGVPISEEESDALLLPLQIMTGYPWDWYWGHRKELGIEGCWQLMPLTAAMEDPFWDWHLDHRRQWFNDKREATNALMRSHET